ncbi:hypothetical protein P154DRAFT_291680 [Amniculicola lignicola CBS 123094]|uniref:Uncharacterized protein n=1 Tax=Amniculicola lignicola CBS 123094 TaxID=1392246 RepID=A0A6A5X0H3_9PLEO|nr:hypothetical protein P154DRAFT_291680 [Amniculicola lignicola CBS 123094]
MFQANYPPAKRSSHFGDPGSLLRTRFCLLLVLYAGVTSCLNEKTENNIGTRRVGPGFGGYKCDAVPTNSTAQCWDFFAGVGFLLADLGAHAEGSKSDSNPVVSCIPLLLSFPSSVLCRCVRGVSFCTVFCFFTDITELTSLIEFEWPLKSSSESSDSDSSSE